LQSLDAAMAAAIDLFGALAYAVIVVRTGELVWIAIDPDRVRSRIRQLAQATPWVDVAREHRALRPVFLVARTTALVIASQLIVRDANFVSPDESNYLATLRSGRCARARAQGLLAVRAE
jgi:hypothetical protein